MNFQFDLTITMTVILSVIVMIFTWFRTRREDVDDQFREVADNFKEATRRMDRQEGRIAALEQTVRALPAKDDMHSLQLKMSEINGSMREIRAVMAGNAQIMERIETIVSRHEDHLLEEARK